VYVDGFVFDESVTAVSCDEDGLHVAMRAGTTPLRVTLVEDMMRSWILTPARRGPTPDLLEANDPALVDWLGSEMDDEVLEVLHRYRACATGDEPEQPTTDINVASIEPVAKFCHDTRDPDGSGRRWTDRGPS
jgi:hypothetical protein